MPSKQIRWHRLFAVYFALAIISLIAGALTAPPFHGPLLFSGVFLLAAFVPLVMLIYFLRGLLGGHLISRPPIRPPISSHVTSSSPPASPAPR